MQDASFRQLLDSLSHTYELAQRTTAGTESQAVEEQSRNPVHLISLAAVLLVVGLAGWWRMHRK